MLQPVLGFGYFGASDINGLEVAVAEAEEGCGVGDFRDGDIVCLTLNR